MFLLWLMMVCFSAHAQVDTLTMPDSLSLALDSLKPTPTYDSLAVVKNTALAKHTSILQDTAQKVYSIDVQQTAPHKSNTVVFFVLVLLLVILTYIKVAFGKDLEDMLQSFANRNTAQQVLRTQSDELSFSALLLHFNFIIVVSLYLRFFLVKYYHVTSLESLYSILFLIFLFTFFYLAKLLVVKLIGVVFELNTVCDEYIFNFTTICKTLGLSLIPALFIFYTAPKKFFDVVFVASIVVIAGFIIMFIYRGLSTGYKLMYRSVYHFFIYVCVVEISPIFLLLKLLTKTVV